MGTFFLLNLQLLLNIFLNVYYRCISNVDFVKQNI